MKEIKFSLGGATAVAFLGGKITPEDLYGAVKTLVEKEGRPLESGYLSPDGRLLRRQQISTVNLDPEGSPVEAPLMTFDSEPVEQSPSSFEKEAALQEVPVTQLVGFNVSDVYAIDVAGMKPGLYETTFNYRASYQPRAALLLVKPSEAYLLVGQAKRISFVGNNLTYEFFDSVESDAAEADPLDFSMM
ncbi:MAG TPA: hypothetical protein PLX89_20305 [Verrucomicrobiota bacterium]|nr:hypothetical protein [Verrucomicrobiales bacterium]HRI15344.1 hypothetical protein [Verrucomicrobiota bacterium]